MITSAQRHSWEEQGFFNLPAFASRQTVRDMLHTADAMADRADRGESLGDAYPVSEGILEKTGAPWSTHLSKIFRVHRTEPAFKRYAFDAKVIALMGALLGSDFDCFLSQFIFKLPGALGQPWHQDAFYFPFSGPPAIGIWLAVTEAHMNNGPLWVLPGSHREPIHRVHRDRREGAHAAYVEITDQNFEAALPVMMQPGDLLVFHSHLMHKSTDNVSQGRRAAMVYHFASTQTKDESMERYGQRAPNIDWMAVTRGGVSCAADGAGQDPRRPV